MKTNLFQLITLIHLLVFVSGCNMESDVEVPAVAPKLVVNSYISPETDTLFVSVLLSKPLFTITNYNEWDYVAVADAVVEITGGGQQVVLTFLPYEKRFFTTEVNVLPGEEYTLQVRTPEGEQVKARCTVPNKLPPAPEDMTVETTPQSYEKALRFILSDPAGKGDYYRVSAGIESDIEQPGYPWPKFFSPIGFQQGEEFVSDASYDGSSFLYKTEWMFNGPSSPIRLYISQTDDHYFKFHQSIINYQDENPFAEPTPVYSNIEGGLGVFAAFRSIVVEVDMNNLPSK